MKDNLQLLIKDFVEKTRYTQDVRSGEKYFPQAEVEKIIAMAYSLGEIDGSSGNEAHKVAMEDMIQLMGDEVDILSEE